MTEYLPKTDDCVQDKVVVTSPVDGGQLVTHAGAPAGANSPLWVGIAARPAGVGETVTVFTGGLQRPVAATNIAQGDRLKTAANGQVTTWVSGTDAADLLVGVAREAATAGAKFVARFIR